MILSVHAIFGSAVASLVPTHPVLGFGLGFCSHLLLDMIPHRDYDLLSVESDKKKKIFKLSESVAIRKQLLADIMIVSLDAFVGIVLSFIFFFNSRYPLVFLIGAIGSMLPDFFTFLYLLFKWKILKSFFSFHSEVLHSQFVFNIGPIFGVILQYITVAILIVIGIVIKNAFLVSLV